MADKCPQCGGTDIIFGESPRNLVVHNEDTYHTECLIEILGGKIPLYIRVYKGDGDSWLCKRIADHYEVVAEGNSQSIADLITTLNAF